jgi:hypothetical protein
VARHRVQDVQRALEESRARVWALIKGLCPELLVDLPESCKPLCGMSPELRAVLVPGRVLNQYEPTHWPSTHLQPGNASHIVRPYRFGGEAVMLKEYSMAHAQQRRMLEREVVAIARLNHPHVIRLQAMFLDEDDVHALKAYVQTPLCMGGTLSLARARARRARAR